MQTNVTISWLVTVSASIGVDLTGIPGVGGTHGGTYYKSPAVEAKKTHFPTLNASNLVLKILQYDKIWGDDPPRSKLYLSPPRDLCPRVSGEEDK